MKSVRALLEGLIDYVGLFPPPPERRERSMASAVRNYAAYSTGENGWILGKFILPSKRVGEFASLANDLTADWRLSLLVWGELTFPEWLMKLHPWIAPAVSSVEMMAERPEAIRKRHAELVTYFEIPYIRQAEAYLPLLAETGGRARITGDLIPGWNERQLLPPPARELAEFLMLSAAYKVPFKASAGLFHPVYTCVRLDPILGPAYERSEHPFFHFLNVFLAAAIVYSGGDADDARATLEEKSQTAFRFDDGSVSWHGHRLTTEQLREVREKFAISFESYSFEEPIADLEALGIL